MKPFLGLRWLAFVVVLLPGPARADEMDRAFLDRAPGIHQYLRQHYLAGKNTCAVGVLPFTVRQGQATDPGRGPFGRRVAGRLELALILSAQDERIRVLHDAGTVAAKYRRADPGTEEGRAELFRPLYLPTWGTGERVPATVFLTGRVDLGADGRRASVQVYALGRNQKPEPFLNFGLPCDARTLTEVGMSYARARGKTGDAPVLDDRPAASAKGLVEWDIDYDGKPVHLDTRDGRAVIREKVTDRTEVAFHLRNKGPAPCGALLLINGKSTLDPEETLDPAEAGDSYSWDRWPRFKKWVLYPASREKPYYIIDCYQEGLERGRKFRVLPPEESEREAARTGLLAGTFTLVVFPAASPASLVKPKAADDDVAAMALGRGNLARVVGGVAMPQTLKELQTRLRNGIAREAAQAKGAKGQLFAPGDAVDSRVKEASAPLDAEPVESITVYYAE